MIRYNNYDLFINQINCSGLICTLLTVASYLVTLSVKLWGDGYSECFIYSLFY